MKSLMFIIVVIVYLQYLRERSGKKKEVFAAYIIRLANRFSLRSCDHFRNILDVQVSIATVPLSSSFYLARAIEKLEKKSLLPRRTRHRALLQFQIFQAGVTGEPETNKVK